MNRSLQIMTFHSGVKQFTDVVQYLYCQQGRTHRRDTQRQKSGEEPADYIESNTQLVLNLSTLKRSKGESTSAES